MKFTCISRLLFAEGGRGLTIETMPLPGTPLQYVTSVASGSQKPCSDIFGQKTVLWLIFMAFIQSSMCFGQVDLRIVHAWWQSDPGSQELTPVLNTHLYGVNPDRDSSSTPPTSFRIYWADGPSLTNKMDLVYSEAVPSIASDNQWDRDDSLIPASSLIPPAGASHVILVIDEDNRVQEVDENNNIQSFSVAVSLEVATPPLVFPYVPGLSFAYRVTFKAGFLQQWVPITPTTAQLFWANGPTIQDRTSSIPIYSHPIEGPFWGHQLYQENVHVDASLFHDPPDGTTCVLLVLGSPEALLAAESADGSAATSDQTNKLQMLSTEKFLIAEVTIVKGTVTVLRDGGPIPLSVKDRVFKGDVITTAERSLVKLRFLEGSEIQTVGPETTFTVDKAELYPSGFLARQITQLKGKIRAKVTKRLPAPARTRSFT